MSPLRARRVRAAWAAVGTIALGLAVHGGLLPLGALTDKAGDALSALLVYAGLVVLFPARAPRGLALWTCAFCFAIELSQLWHPAWLDAVRRTTLGGLILGQTFDALDGLAYAVGAAAGALGDPLSRWTPPRRAPS